MKKNKKPLSSLILLINILLLITLIPLNALSKVKGDFQENSDVEIVTNPKTPKPIDGFKIRIVFEEELSIGEIEGDENQMFGNRVYFNTDVDGNIYINDWDRKRIQKFDPNGDYLLTIGRKGRGPGEFINAWVPRFDKDGNIYVYDMANRRISFFMKQGEFLRQIALKQGISIHNITSKGLFFGGQSKILSDSDVFSYSVSYGLFDKDLNLVVEIYSRTTERKRDTTSRARYLADIYSGDAYDPQLTFFMDENEFIYLGYPEKYEIKILSPEGTLLKIVQREYDPIKISKKHKEKFINYVEDEYMRFSPADESLKKEIFQLIKYPKYLPAYETFTLMENGWIFAVVDSSEKDARLIDIFDKDGRYIAQFTESVPTDGLIFKNGKAYALAIENDYRFVKRYRYEIQEYRDKKWAKKK